MTAAQKPQNFVPVPFPGTPGSQQAEQLVAVRPEPQDSDASAVWKKRGMRAVRAVQFTTASKCPLSSGPCSGSVTMASAPALVSGIANKSLPIGLGHGEFPYAAITTPCGLTCN